MTQSTHFLPAWSYLTILILLTACSTLQPNDATVQQDSISQQGSLSAQDTSTSPIKLASNVSVRAGGSGAVRISVDRTQLTGALTLTLTGLPAGVQALPLQLAANLSTGVIMLDADATVLPSGPFALSVILNGQITVPKVNLTVLSSTAPDFGIAPLTTLSIPSGATTTLPVNILRQGGYAAGVYLSAVGFPTQLTFSSAALSSAANTGNLQVTATNGTPAGTYSGFITGFSGTGLSHAQALSVLVTPPAPTPPPSGGGLWNTIESPRAWDYQPTVVSQAACAGTGNTYDVGPGQTLTQLGQVPWLGLLPCDTVKIHYSPTPYREVIQLTNRGAAGKYIRVVGVPGPNGELPILDGQGATVPAGGLPFINPVLEGYGLIVVSPPKGYTYGYKPGYIEIANLEIRNAYKTSNFTKGDGSTVAWDDFASGIYIERAENVAIRNCHIHDNGNGIFQNSKFGEAAQSRYLLIEGNDVHDNGVAGDAHEHNSYTEGVGTVYQFNHFGQPRVGSYGDNIKERSAGITFRYNTIEGGVHNINLLDPQSNGSFERVQKDAWGQLLVNSAYIYGNTLIMRDRPGWTIGWPSVLVGFGDGDVSYGDVRGGTLYFYNNTVVSEYDTTTYGKKASVLFEMNNAATLPVVQARNNIFFATSPTVGKTTIPFSIFYHYGTAQFDTNWLSAGWMTIEPSYHAPGNILASGTPWNGSGMGAIINNAANTPGFASLSSDDFHLLVGSSAKNMGVALDPEIIKTQNVPVFMPDHQLRSSTLDLGAFGQ